MARRDLEAAFKKWRRVHGPAPKEGWIRTIREALEMRADDLAARSLAADWSRGFF